MNKENRVKKSKYFCMVPWTHMHFLPDGKVIPCCLAPTEEVIGDIKKESLYEIWNSEKFRTMRQHMLNDQFCSECTRCYSKEEDLPHHAHQSNQIVSKHLVT